MSSLILIITGSGAPTGMGGDVDGQDIVGVEVGRGDEDVNKAFTA